VFNGIRTLAMMWVVIGHVYLNSLAGNVNTPSAEDIFKKPFTLIIEAGLLSVDVFFFMGGFFLAFVFLREKNKSWLKYPFAILQRVLRIWPCYIITILIYYSVFMHLGSGPRWIQN
jgi:peptidoglycan/LPS O-acetylase OafA/YrhL